jgi:hypothetical protein
MKRVSDSKSVYFYTFVFWINHNYGARSFKPATRRQEELTVIARNCEL